MSPAISPINAPTNTCFGVCPNTSTSFSDTSTDVNPGVSIILFSNFACFPAALLTHAASYITTNANTSDNANIGLPTPTSFPINVANPTTTAE